MVYSACPSLASSRFPAYQHHPCPWNARASAQSHSPNHPDNLKSPLCTPSIHLSPLSRRQIAPITFIPIRALLRKSRQPCAITPIHTSETLRPYPIVSPYSRTSTDYDKTGTEGKKAHPLLSRIFLTVNRRNSSPTKNAKNTSA